MGIIIRRYKKHEIPVLVKILERILKDFHYKTIMFDVGKIENMLYGNVNNKSGFFLDVVEKDNEIIGAFGGHIAEFPFSYEVLAIDSFIYIDPKHRSYKTITTLVKNYIKWGKQCGARQIRLCQSTGHNVKKFRSFAKRMGFTEIGSHHNMEITQ